MSKKPPHGSLSGGAGIRGGGAPRAGARLVPRGVAMVRELVIQLESSASAISDAHEDFFSEIVRELADLLMDDHGGDPLARRARAAVYAEFDKALDGAALDPPALLLAAKIFSDAGWDVPERLKRQLMEDLEAAEPELNEAGADLGSTLGEIAEASEGDAFAAYDALSSVLAAFPSGAAGAMVGALAEGHAPVLRHVLAGFAMHRDATLAQAAIEALHRVARTERAESALVERLVRMRPWLPSDRQPLLDETIRAMRAHAESPVVSVLPEGARCFAMACDGTGAAGLLASLKANDGWRFVAAMTRPSGVEEAISVEGLSKRESDAAMRGMRETVTTARTDVEGLARCLELALGENVSSGAPPPFRLIALAESLGLGPIAPRVISPADLVEEILADLPAAETSAEAVALARRMRFEDSLTQPWFEAGEPVERLLAPLRGAKSRVKALLRDYLPERRTFWTRACAMTAFALRLEPKTYASVARSLALIGRDLADGVALEDIGLMRDIATLTVAAYESHVSGQD